MYKGGALPILQVVFDDRDEMCTFSQTIEQVAVDNNAPQLIVFEYDESFKQGCHLIRVCMSRTIDLMSEESLQSLYFKIIHEAWNLSVVDKTKCQSIIFRYDVYLFSKGQDYTPPVFLDEEQMQVLEELGATFELNLLINSEQSE